ncbi:ABC transporter substrate-binding protein, partial [Bradyrhizobium sp.]
MTLHRYAALSAVVLAVTLGTAKAETIRVAIGTQDTTINCATGGLLIRELNLLDKYLPHDGKYKDTTYDIQWRNFTSGAPLTNEMVAGKLDFGAMADFPGSLNGVAFQKAGRRSLFISVLSGSTKGSGNGIVVPKDSPARSLDDLKGKTISVPFASTAHGMLLRAIEAKGWNPDTDVSIITQAPEVAGPALQANKVDAHADFVPFAELFPWRGFARKIFDGSQASTPTFHGALVDGDYADKYPEVVTAYLRAALEADRLIASEPERYSELISKVTGIEAEVVYLFHGPLGLQTRGATWKPEFRQAVATSIKTLKYLKRADSDLDIDKFVTDKFVRAALTQAGRDYDAEKTNYAQLPLKAKDAASGAEITDVSRVAQIWLKDEPQVRHYASPEAALKALVALEKDGKTARVVYAQDRESGIKLFASQAWFVRSSSGEL